jgi:hypothetical protein
MIAEQWFDQGKYELNEWYLYGNGWAVRVRTNLASGIRDASSTAWLMRRNPYWVSGDSPGFAVRGREVPEQPWAFGHGLDSAGEPVLWFTEDGESPDWMTPDGLTELCAGVALLEPRPDE